MSLIHFQLDFIMGHHHLMKIKVCRTTMENHNSSLHHHGP